MTVPSYHDAVVTLNGVDYCLFDEPYDLMITCTRAGGWELWRNRGSTVHEAKLLGGEYSGDDFKISIAGHIICEGKKDESIKATD